MKPIELMKRLGGEALANKLRAKIDGKIVILARLEGEEYVLTDTGFKVAAELNAKISAEPESTEEEAPTKKTVTRTRKQNK